MQKRQCQKYKETERCRDKNIEIDQKGNIRFKRGKEKTQRKRKVYSNSETQKDRERNRERKMKNTERY